MWIRKSDVQLVQRKKFLSDVINDEEMGFNPRHRRDTWYLSLLLSSGIEVIIKAKDIQNREEYIVRMDEQGIIAALREKPDEGGLVLDDELNPHFLRFAASDYTIKLKKVGVR